MYIGRILAHSAPVTGLMFGYKDNKEILISVSEDKYCVEYDLYASSLANGVIAVGGNSGGSNRHRLELTAVPTAVMLHPHLEDDVEDRFVIANNEFKLKEFNTDSKHCRKTTLAPTYGINPTDVERVGSGAPNKLIPIPVPTKQMNGAGGYNAGIQ